jgi:hypothetical protein
MVNEIKIPFNTLLWFKDLGLSTIDLYFNGDYLDEVKVNLDNGEEYIIVNFEKVYLKTLKKL